MFWVIVSSLIPVFGIILLGFLTARRGLLPANAVTCLNQYVYWIALPGLFFTLMATMDPDRLSAGLFAGTGAGFAASYAFCFLLVRMGGRSAPSYATLATCVATFPNVMFMAVPIITFLLPGNQEALFIASLAALLYLPVLLYTDTALEMHRHKGEQFGQSMRSLVRAVSRNPSIVAPACGLTLSLSGIATPAYILNMTSMLGNTAAPCALFVMGMVLHLQLASAQGFARGLFIKQLPVVLTKLFVMPLLTYTACRFFNVSGVALGAIVICAAMPSAIAINVLAEKYQTAVKETSLAICLNTAGSMLSLCAVIALMFALGVF